MTAPFFTACTHNTRSATSRGTYAVCCGDVRYGLCWTLHKRLGVTLPKRVGGWEEEGRRGREGQLCCRVCPILRSVYTKCSTPKRAGHCEASDIVVPIRVFEVSQRTIHSKCDLPKGGECAMIKSRQRQRSCFLDPRRQCRRHQVLLCPFLHQHRHPRSHQVREPAPCD